MLPFNDFQLHNPAGYRSAHPRHACGVRFNPSGNAQDSVHRPHFAPAHFTVRCEIRTGRDLKGIPRGLGLRNLRGIGAATGERECGKSG
jgi:hypothetical protein